MIIKTYTICEKSTADSNWLTSFKLFEDGLSINSGFKDSLTLDYDEIIPFKKALIECKSSGEAYVPSDKENSYPIHLFKNSQDAIEVTLEDEELSFLVEIWDSEYNDFVEILDLVIVQYNL